MIVGKVSETVLKRSVLKQIGHRRGEVLISAGLGEDCSAVSVEADEVIVLSTDPITGSEKDMGTLVVHMAANDIVTSGATPIGVLVNIILPDGAREIAIKRIMGQMEQVCEALEMEILGGHTEVSDAVNRPLVTVTGVGKVKKDELLTTKGLKPGDELVITKWIGLEGTAILASEKFEDLTQRYTKDFISTARDFMQYLSVVKEAKIAREMGACCMHDITEGGVYGALWDIATASDLGVEVSLNKIPVRQETIEICEFFDLNPYQLMSGGALLIGTKHGNAMVAALEQAGIPAVVIGRAVKGNDKVILSEGERRFLEPPKSDERYKVQK